MSVVDWTYGAQHMWDNHKVAAAEADEAVNDIDAVWLTRTRLVALTAVFG